MIPQPRELKRYGGGTGIPEAELLGAKATHCRGSPLPVTRVLDISRGARREFGGSWTEGLYGALKTRGAKVTDEDFRRPWITKGMRDMCEEMKPGEAFLSGPLCELPIHMRGKHGFGEVLVAVHIINGLVRGGKKEGFAESAIEVHVSLAHGTEVQAEHVLQGLLGVGPELNHSGYLVGVKLPSEEFGRTLIPATVAVYTAMLNVRLHADYVPPEVFCDEGVMMQVMETVGWLRCAVERNDRHLIEVAEHMKTAAALRQAPDNSSKRDMMKDLAEKYTLAAGYARSGSQEDRLEWVARRVESIGHRSEF